MAKMYGPLFSLKASGTIAKACNYAEGKGIHYARRKPHPPQHEVSTAQQAQRAYFRSMLDVWAAQE